MGPGEGAWEPGKPDSQRSEQPAQPAICVEAGIRTPTHLGWPDLIIESGLVGGSGSFGARWPASRECSGLSNVNQLGGGNPR